MASINKDNVADLFVHGQSRGGNRATLFMSRAGKLKYQPIEIRGSVRASRVLPADFNGDGKADLAAFGHSHRTVPGVFIRLRKPRQPEFRECAEWSRLARAKADRR